MKKYGIVITLLLALALLYGITGTGCSHSTFNPAFEVKVLGSSNFMAGSQGALRIITFEPSSGEPVSNVPISIYLQKPAQGAGGSGIENQPVKPRDPGDNIFRGRTGPEGTLDASFPIPDDREGSLSLTIAAGIPGKTTDVEATVNIRREYKIYLTTDKPLYQPGQVINIRALALSIPSMKPMAGQDALLEVMDAKGNKVFKQTGQTSDFGITFARFQLADEVNMGTYKITVTVDNQVAEKSVNVERYVLPKYKIDYQSDRKFYRPGDTIKGKVQVDYFFGKPVAGGTVNVKLHTFDVEFRPVAEVKGTTDKSGHYEFEIKLPDHLVGQPLEKGKAVTKLDIEVADTAGQKQTAVRMIPVSGNALAVKLFPEGGNLRQGLENKVFIITSYPDGSPAKSTINLSFLDQTRVITTDEAGISSFTITPPIEKSQEDSSQAPPAPPRGRIRRPGRHYHHQNQVPIRIQATTPEGQSLNATQNLVIDDAIDNVILRTDRAEYRVGQSITMDVLSTLSRGTVYVDFIRNRQTILTKSFPIRGNVTQYVTEVTPDMLGLVTINAYRITQENQIIRDTRNVYIQGADDLKIAIKPDKESFLPGKEAKISFTVTDPQGKPVLAALGVDIVDEAVFALGEMMPGLEKVYFLLEKQLMEAKYEVHGVTIRDVAMTPQQVDQNQQTLKKVLFSQIPDEVKYDININTYDQKMDECYEKMTRIDQGIYKYFQKHQRWPQPGQMDTLVKEGFVKTEDVLDPWGRKFFIAESAQGRKNPDIISAGPNGIVGDKDDLKLSVMQTSHRYTAGRRDMDNGVLGRDAVLRARPPMEDMMMDGAAMPQVAAEKMESPRSSAPAGEPRGQEPVRVREYFPETLYTNPQIITDEKGNAQIGLTVADSITTWRMSAFGNSMEGKMGSATGGLRVFQDFFIDIDFPVALTQGDQVAVPIAAYNYLKEDQDVKLTVTPEDWFELMDEGEKTISLKPDQVDGVHFRIKVKKLGNHRLTVTARGSKFSDAVRRQIMVLPDGQEVNNSISDRLEGQVSKVIDIPANAIPDASRIFVRIYPGVVSQVMEGLDKILRMPSGCFEQTTATTYPNVLILEYLNKNKKITPEIQMKAEGYINTGYQRLVSYEVPGGGFSWFGQAPANRCLTALGLLQFRDMSKVHFVDDNMINRTQRWLASQQNQDGSWSPDGNYLHAETWSKMQGGGKVPVTAYIVWAMAESGYRGQDLTKGLEFLKKNSGQINDPYVLSLVCNAMAQLEPGASTTKETVDRLAKMAKTDKDTAQWSTGVQTATYTRGANADMETTALAVLALLKSDTHTDLAGRGITFLIKSKDSYGTWYSTQTTILAMKALLLSQEKATSQVDAKVKISVNGGKIQEFEVNADNYDLYRQADFTADTKNGRNRIEISIEGKGSCFYQIASRHYVPWKLAKAEKPLSIDVAYDRKDLEANDMLTCTATVKNNTGEAMKMVMIDLGIPPGFTVMSPDLDEHVGKTFEKYTLTSRQLIIYTDTINPGQTVQFKYRLQARYPLRAQTPRSRAYQYYNPEVEDFVEPVTLQVK